MSDRNFRPKLLRSSMIAAAISFGSLNLLMAQEVRITISPDAVPASQPKPPENDNANDRPVVQIALLLDTSNSMDGLIHQARTQLWSIVNDISKSKRDGKLPKLQVALYEYGNNNLPAGEGYVRMVLPLTSDLDLLSEKLWALTTNGGSEFCGQVIDNSTRELSWNESPGAYRAVFIAGNEPFTQGSVDFRLAVGKALSKEIIINTIHCGSYQEGVQGKWLEASQLGRGKYLVIDQDKVAAHVPSPQDDKLIKLSTDLNLTYLPFGGKVAVLASERQVAQDVAVAGDAGANVARANAKAGGNYDNRGWDLIDALTSNSVKLESLKPEELPDVLKSKSLEEQLAIIETTKSKRAEIQKLIVQTNLEREAFVEAQRKEQAPQAGQTLDQATRAAIREQLVALGYVFE